MKTRLIVFTVTLLMSLALFAGCYESSDITYHEPGEYKGKSDPLLKKEQNPKQREMLVERFNKVQTDR